MPNHTTCDRGVLETRFGIARNHSRTSLQLWVAAPIIGREHSFPRMFNHRQMRKTNRFSLFLGKKSSDLRLKTPKALQPRSLVTINTLIHTASAESARFALLHRPGIPSKRPLIPDRMLVMGKRNNKVYAVLGDDSQFTVRFLTVLDTGAAIKFVVESLLPPLVW